MKRLNFLDIIAFILIIVGGLNWGLIGAFNFDLVAFLFGNMTALSKIVYSVVGISAVYSLYTLSKLVKSS